VGDMIAITGFNAYTHTPSISGGTLQGSWCYRDVGGSTYLVCGIIKATSSTVTVGATDTSWIAKGVTSANIGCNRILTAHIIP
jgi:hypothetical protein